MSKAQQLYPVLSAHCPALPLFVAVASESVLMFKKPRIYGPCPPHIIHLPGVVLSFLPFNISSATVRRNSRDNLIAARVSWSQVARWN